MELYVKQAGSHTLLTGIITFFVFHNYVMATPQVSGNTRINEYNRLKQQQPDKNYIINKLKLYEHLFIKYEKFNATDIGWEAENPDDISQAIKAHKLAKLSLQAGDLKTAQVQIDLAINLVTKVLSLQRNVSNELKSAQKKYKQTVERIEGFYQALRTISQEKEADITTFLNQNKYEDYLQQAEQYSARNEMKQALDVVEKAAFMVEKALATIREKETIVHTLKFDSLDDEYEYELERNRSHELLVKYMIEQKKINLVERKKFDDLLNENQKLRNKAYALKEVNNTEGAKKMLETGTDKLVKALRIGGIFIP